MEFVPGLISVIMSNYNTPEEYLRDAIESVLNQTYNNFEFIIIDDCSTDNSLDIIKSYDDERIVILENEENLGITKSLNRGLSIAKGEFVARMDGDDICLPTRFKKQVEFLKNNKDVVVCGTWVELFGDGADVYNEKLVCKNIPNKEEFQIRLLFGNHTNIIHPTAMFKHDILDCNNIKYDERYIYAQDYRMWISCSRVGECANVPQVLLKYRVHKKAVSTHKKDVQNECAKNIMAEQLSWLELSLSENWEEIHYGFLVGRKPYNTEFKNWIEKIVSNNKKYKIFNQQKLEKTLWGKWVETSYFALTKERNPFNVIKILRNLPVKYWGELLKIRKSRANNA